MGRKKVSQSNIFAKECIVSALLKLTKDMPLSSISISELCFTAGVSRMTFYRNYDSLEDIFLKTLSDIFDDYKNDDMSEGLSGAYCDKKHIIHYLKYLYQYRDFLNGLVSCGYDVIFLNMLDSYIQEKWLEKTDRYTLILFSGALYNIFRYWASNGYEESPEELSDIIESSFASGYH